MFMFSDQRSVQLLDDSREGATFEDVVRLSRQVVAEVAPAELEIFPLVVDGFRDDPAAEFASAGRREPVGMGFDFAAVSALVLAMGSVLGGIATDEAGNVLGDALGELFARPWPPWSAAQAADSTSPSPSPNDHPYPPQPPLQGWRYRPSPTRSASPSPDRTVNSQSVSFCSRLAATAATPKRW
jgi:hypothetical protein